MKDIIYDDLDLVLKSWDDARFGKKNFNQDFGMNCLDRMFEIQPRSKQVFGYTESDHVSKERAATHGRLFATVFDSVFQMLGPDTEFIEEVLRQVGRRHRTMGIHPMLFPYMGKALLYALEQALDRKLTHRETLAWEEIYDAISSELVRHILSDV
ncbi:hypothetical protein ACA910_008505 [Epithemia clementina (nom. ined.)]